MSMDWWRAHHGISNDSKLCVIALRAKSKKCEVGWVWVILLDFASQNEDRGSVAGLDNEQIAVMSDLSIEQVESIVSQFKERGLIQQDGRLSAWTKRQPVRERPDDNSVERVRRYRERQRDVTPSNAQIRVDEIREEENINPQTPCAPSGAGLNGHAPKQSRKRKDKRTTEEVRAALGPERLVWWENFWDVFPCHDGINEGMNAFEIRVKDHELAVAVWKGAKSYRAKCDADPTIKVKFAQGWINSERWLDENNLPAVIPRPAQRSFVDDVQRLVVDRISKGEQPW